MVERITLLKLHESKERAEVAKFVRAALIDLPGVEEVSVGLPADVAAAKSWDISVLRLFASEAATNIVLESDGFKTFIEELSPRVQVIKAWNFERLG